MGLFVYPRYIRVFLNSDWVIYSTVLVEWYKKHITRDYRHTNIYFVNLGFKSEIEIVIGHNYY